MYVGRHFAGCVLTDILNHVKETIKIDKNGYGEFLVEDGSVSVWKPKKGEKSGKRAFIAEDKSLLNKENEFGRFENGIFRDNIEVSAYAEVSDGVEPKLFYGSNYTHMRDEATEKKKPEEDAEKEPDKK